jgi:hypothetical protein
MEQAEVMLESFRTGELPCAAVLNQTFDALRQLFGNWIAVVSERVLIPPILMRMLRCDPIDQQVIRFMVETLLAEGNSPRTQNATMIINPIVNLNIGLSELYSNQNPLPNLQEQIDLDQSLLFSGDIQTQFTTAYPIWQEYPPDQFRNLFPNTSIPVLVLEGELDPQTTHAWGVHASKHYTRPGQMFVSVPYAPHGTVFFSPQERSLLPCGLEIMVSFMLSDGLKPDLSCLDSLTLPDFDGVTPGTIALSKAIFNLTDMWGSS